MNKPADAARVTWGLVPLRIVLGAVFIMHGTQKLFDFGVAGTADILGKLGIPFATGAAILLIVLETLGGAAILVGAYARPVALLLAIEMCVAIPVARFKGGFFTPYGYEFEVTLLGACLTLALLGSGGISLGDRFGKGRPTT